MVMKLDKVVPFGRLLTEYQLMFRLTPGDMNDIGFEAIPPPRSNFEGIAEPRLLH